MAPVVPVMIYWFIVLLCGGFCVGSLALMGWGWRRKRRGVILFGATTLFLSAFAALRMFGGTFADRDAQVKAFMNLPPAARVVEFDPSDWGDGTVVLRLPADKSPPDWIRTVWQMNRREVGAEDAASAAPGAAIIRKSPLDWEWHFNNGDECELRYEPSTDLYWYVVTANV